MTDAVLGPSCAAPRAGKTRPAACAGCFQRKGAVVGLPSLRPSSSLRYSARLSRPLNHRDELDAGGKPPGAALVGTAISAALLTA